MVVTLQDLAPLEELGRLRAEFLGMVSHELRTPLTSIKGSASTALETSTSLNTVEAHQFFRIINEQADHMHGLISDLLDAGSIDTGTLSVLPAPTELAALVDNARNAFLSGGSTHAILIDLPQDLPRVLADKGRIVQVLNNLFNNAARFSPGSSPIRVAARHEGLHVAVSVSDEGRGITPEQLQRLFRRYTGLSGDEGRGSGLGLAICKGIVEAHGGRIRAASDGPGQGTQITFTIPVAEEPGDVAEQAPPSCQGSERPPVLVVDDDPQTLRFVRDALAQGGYSPLVTGDYRELSRIIRAEQPHLILLDLLLPGTDGIDLMEKVPEMAALPVIFISAYSRGETIARALEQGAVDYIVKPFSATELNARVRAALRRQAKLERFVLGDLAISYRQREVTVATRPVRLTATEYELLRILSMNAGQVVTYDSLLRQLWSGPERGGPNRIRTFVKQLRRKLGDDTARQSYIQNVRAVGYRMA
ncbi:MAG: ATP-binding protein [Gammaproteobacteria bacterium]|nr:ATP-binding protein [Gammaproteobacteria bacterium]